LELVTQSTQFLASVDDIKQESCDKVLNSDFNQTFKTSFLESIKTRKFDSIRSLDNSLKQWRSEHTSSFSDDAESSSSSSLDDIAANKSSMVVVDEESNEQVLQMYAQSSSLGLRQFESDVSKAMSRCLFLSLQSLEKRHKRYGAGIVEGSTEKTGYTQFPNNTYIFSYIYILYIIFFYLEENFPSLPGAQNIFARIEERQKDLAGGRTHFEVLFFDIKLLVHVYNYNMIKFLM
jgi:hypothetical protein